MADNIKIIGSINNIQRINRLKLEDLNLLNSQVKNQTFGFENDYIEYFIYDAGGNLINSNYNYRSFKLPSNSYLTPNVELPLIEIDPTSDLQTLGYISGQFKTQYNFQTRKISSPDAELFLNQISEDRTEIEIKSIIISSDDLIKYGTDLINELENSAEQKYYILNTTNNTQILVVNIAVNVENSSILFKLYEPLPQTVLTKEKCWVTEEIIEPYVFDINLDTSVIPADSLKLRGPNFGIELDIKQNLSTEYQNYSNLVSSLTGSSYQKVLNFMNDKSYDLNIDYTSFENFIHFSSAKTRLSNFYNKVKQIENYNNDINIITGSTNILKNEQTASIKLKIDNLIQNFDGFERYMYFESSSYAWPKSTNNKPYSLLSTGSNISKIWYNSYTGSAESYDINNLDYLYYSLPNYVKNDPNNYQQYYNFIDMIGHYFDNIWIYISSINDLYNADNNLEKGISKDIVYDQLKSLGINLYNSKGDDDFDYYINGLNEGSTLFIDDFSITSSYLNNLSKKDLLAETYKRIYHNIPLLTKTKGTSIGLKNLINTFGITGSILSPKEFGGSTKKNEIKGYDNDKITIKNNTITGNVLSPFISLQNNPTSSIEFTSTDLHFIDLSFSPQNELNTRVSSSIAFLNPTFSLDEYIGDPRLIESASYNELINQNNYFISASSAISGSAQRLDYKGFIELVKYFDNSLFKMLKDFVPARTNALTGITIKSPILERNKIKSYKPKLTEETVYDAEYTAPVISEDRDYHYDKIEGNKSSFYTGELTGSYANINDIFENSNPNNYLHPTSSININQFEHTDFNVTLNNVSSSVLSNNKFKLENIYTNTNTNIFKTLNQYSSSAELQDSYESLLGHSNSRYNGTKLTSLTYNTYSSSSYTGSNGIDIQNGDISFGKSPVINHNTRKIGLFTQIKQNNILEYPKKGNVYLKYLVDENGNLTELNKKNKHWNEVQNIFKLGKTSTISQFDSQKFQNQNLIDGVKSVYNSGYYYAPILYASNTDDKLYFDYTGTSTSKQFKINLVGGFISGSTPGSETYPINQGKIYKLFNKSSDDSGPDNVDSLYNDGNAFYQNNGLNTFSTYSVQETGNQKFISAFNIKVDFPNIDLSGSFTFNINKVGGTTLATQTLAAASGYTSTLYTSLNFAKKIGTPLTLSSDLKVYDGSGTYIETINSGTTLYQIYAGAYADGSCNIYGGGTYYVTNTYYSSISSLYNSCIDVYTLPSANKKLYSTPSNNLTDYLYFNLDTGYQTLTLNDKIGFEFITGSGGFNTTNFTASVYAYDSNTNIGTLYNQIQTTQVGNNPYVDRTSPAAQFISGSINKNTLILSTGLSYFENYQFIPSGSGISPANSKYSTYNSVVNPFSPKTGDYVSIYYGTNSYFESNILNVIKDISGSINLVLSDELPSALNKPAYISSDITTFVISSQTKDENNIIINFGKDINYPTSLGFVIPEDIHPDVLNNIDTITKEVKQKLIDLGYQSGSL